VSIERIIGLVGVAIAIVAAFVSIPNASLALLIIGVIVGAWIAREDHVRVIVSAMALAEFAHNFDAVPGAGLYLAAIISNAGLLMAGAAVTVIARNVYARVVPAFTKASAVAAS